MHGSEPTSQLVLFTHAGPFVAEYRSTSAHRSALPQYDSGDEQPVMQLLDHAALLAGKTAAIAGGTVPVNWLREKMAFGDLHTDVRGYMLLEASASVSRLVTPQGRRLRRGCATIDTARGAINVVAASLEHGMRNDRPD